MLKRFSMLSTNALSIWIIILGGFICLQCKNGVTSEEQEKTSGISWQLDSIIINHNVVGTFSFESHEWLASDVSLKVDNSWCRDNDCLDQGRYYSWNAAKQACQKIGPEWQLPTVDQWKALAIQAGGYKDWFTEEISGDAIAANRKLLEAIHPFGPTLSGWRGSAGGYDQVQKVGYYWSKTEYTDEQATVFAVYPKGGPLLIRPMKKDMGLHCRCIRSIE